MSVKILGNSSVKAKGSKGRRWTDHDYNIGDSVLNNLRTAGSLIEEAYNLWQTPYPEPKDALKKAKSALKHLESAIKEM